MNAQQVVAYHIHMAKMFHRYIIPILRRKEHESLRVNRQLRDEHLAMAREVRRLSYYDSLSDKRT